MDSADEKPAFRPLLDNEKMKGLRARLDDFEQRKKDANTIQRGYPQLLAKREPRRMTGMLTGA